MKGKLWIHATLKNNHNKKQKKIVYCIFIHCLFPVACFCTWFACGTLLYMSKHLVLTGKTHNLWRKLFSICFQLRCVWSIYCFPERPESCQGIHEQALSYCQTSQNPVLSGGCTLPYYNSPRGGWVSDGERDRFTDPPVLSGSLQDLKRTMYTQHLAARFNHTSTRQIDHCEKWTV